MKRRGAFVLLLIEELLESSFLLRAALEKKDDVAQRSVVRKGSLVKLSSGKGVGIAGKSGNPGIVHRLQDAGPGRWLRLPREGGE
jgi:hypothetical protein